MHFLYIKKLALNFKNHINIQLSYIKYLGCCTIHQSPTAIYPPLFVQTISLFGSVVVVAFQSIFHAEMHQNDIFFYFLKNIFEIIASKLSKTYKNILIFFETQVDSHFQALFIYLRSLVTKIFFIF